MSDETQVPVINPASAGKSLSFINKTKKKRISKNVLGLPKNANIKPPIISEQEESEILSLLQRQLPAARLPPVKRKKDDTEVNDPSHSKVQKEKRSEMSLGVNELTTGIKKNIIAAALLANDIVPSHLTAHLNFKCSQNKIPYLYVSNLRNVVQEALGFPCIVLGFKTNCETFSSIVKKISAIYDQFKKDESVAEEESETENENEYENEENLCSENKLKMEKVKKEPEFTYKYRTSNQERVFVPENENKPEIKKFDSDFIPVGSENEEEVENFKSLSGISQNLIKKSKKKKFKFENMEIDDLGIKETEEVKKKKLKKDWVIDKQPKNKSFKYVRANITKYQSNPNRKGKSKFIKKKKIHQPERK